MDGDIHVRGGQVEGVKSVLLDFEGFVDSICELGEERFVIRERDRRVGCS